MRRRERVALVTDREACRVYNALKQAITELGGRVEEVRLPREREHGSPIPQAATAFAHSTLIIAPTDKSITHSRETIAACKRGARCITLPGIDEALFLKAGNANYRTIAERCAALHKELKGCNEISVETPSGTALKLSVKGRRWFVNDGLAKRRGAIENIPAGEIFCAPVESKANGRLVIDYLPSAISAIGATGAIGTTDTASSITGTTGNAVPNIVGTELIIEKGKIVAWSDAAASFVGKLKAVGACALVLGEFGIGTNELHRKPIGNILHDEKIAGSAHIAFGNNTGFGGRNKCPIHEDVILLKPTIITNGKVVVKNGRLAKSVTQI